MASSEVGLKRPHSELYPYIDGTCDELDGTCDELDEPFDQCDEFFGPDSDDSSDDEKYDSDETIAEPTTCPDLAAHSKNLQLQSFSSDIDNEVKNLCSPWLGVIELPLIPIMKGIVDLPSVSPLTLDICQFLNGQQPEYWRLAFSPNDFPTPSAIEASVIQVGSKQDSKFQKVKLAILTASYDGNSPVALKTNQSKQFCCRFHNNGKNNHKVLDADYCDKKIGGNVPRRPGGRVLARRNARILSVPCQFKFTLKWTSKYYFIELKNKSGCPTHSHHPQIIDRKLPKPPRLMPENIQKDVAHVHKMSSGGSLSKAYIYSRLGELYDRRSLKLLLEQVEKTQTNANPFEEMIKELNLNPHVIYHALWDHGAEDASLHFRDTKDQPTNRLVGITKLKRTQIHREHYVQDFTHEESMQGMVDYVSNERSARCLTPNQNVFIALAWTSTHESHYFKLFPEVAWCDVTSHSNNSKFCLLIFSCRTSTRKVLNFLRMWIPNERRFSFRWVFHCAIKALGLDVWFKYTRLFMKDGDPQQSNEIRRQMVSSVGGYLSNAFDGTCVYHLIEDGWKRKCPLKSSVPFNCQDDWEKATKKIKTWLYSFMRPGYCECEEEFQLSVTLLFEFL